MLLRHDYLTIHPEYMEAMFSPGDTKGRIYIRPFLYIDLFCIYTNR